MSVVERPLPLGTETIYGYDPPERLIDPWPFDETERLGWLSIGALELEPLPLTDVIRVPQPPLVEQTTMFADPAAPP